MKILNQVFNKKKKKERKKMGEISNYWPNYLLGLNVYKTLESCW